MVYMNSKKIKLIFLITPFLFSCNQPNVGTTSVINRYKDFMSMKEAFDKGVQRYKNNNICVATVFNPMDVDCFSDFNDAYYISGLCSDKKKQVPFDDICPNIYPCKAYIFLTSKDADLFVEFKFQDELISYLPTKLFDSFEKDAAEYEEYIRYYNMFSDEEVKFGEEWYDPEEFSNFTYYGEDSETYFKDRFKTIICGTKVTIFGNIVFSKRTSLENVEKYSTAIKDLIVSKAAS